MTPKPLDEPFLAALLAYIKGEPPHAFHGGGIVTYRRLDEHDDDLPDLGTFDGGKIHLGCLELERRGLVRREKQRPIFVEWRARE
jgi:hypothetical protein